MTKDTSPEARLEAPDNSVLPFQVDALDIRGRVVRVGSMLDAVLVHHNYPNAVKRVIGEAVALTVLLGSSLKFEGRFILQTKTDGPVDMVVVDFVSPDKVRAYARFDAEAVAQAEASNAAAPALLIGRGHLAMTIDQGLSANRYQGVVALDGEGLEAAAHQYFQQSEQIPTRVRLAVGEEMRPGGEPSAWRAGGLLAQFLPAEAGRAAQGDLHPGDAPEGAEQSDVPLDDAWVEAQSLVGTLEDVELLDRALPSEALLYRLFHERGVRVFEPQPIVAHCTCSRARVFGVLSSFSREERSDMVQEDGRISVTCEFCGRSYGFAAEEVLAQEAPAGEASADDAAP
ncbi:Hsp33 family molecular chaperone [Roseixanthobacter pseudopolyaromaticivorans]|uniref:Hsp33 family molecular chaperone n=1 Tax=Xanthobacteraceae TaxID=335928 RepID=UPI00372690AD